MPLWFVIVVLGILEGITEFLPVSSTGHLLIAEHLLDLRHNQVFQALNQGDLFNIVIQCGAVIAVLPLFPERLRQFVFQWRERSTQLYLFKIFVACAITGLPGYLLEKKGYKLPEEMKPVAIALFVGGVGFVLVETWLRGRSREHEVTWPIVCAVGLGQLLAAVFPGTSRSGATILLALLLGLNRVAATEFTFLVGIPTMLAAGALKIFKAVHHGTGGPKEDWAMVGLGFVVAAVVSFIAVKWLLRYIQTHTFVLFGWYRIGLAMLIGVLLLATPVEPRQAEGSPAQKLPPVTASPASGAALGG